MADLCLSYSDLLKRTYVTKIKIWEFGIGRAKVKLGFVKEINTFRAHQIRVYIVGVSTASTSIAPIIIIWCNVITSV